MCLDDSRQANLRANGDLLPTNLAVVSMALAVIVNLDFAINALAGIVVVEAVQRVNACVKTAVAELRVFFFVGLARFELEIAASHVAVKSLV